MNLYIQVVLRKVKLQCVILSFIWHYLGLPINSWRQTRMSGLLNKIMSLWLYSKHIHIIFMLCLLRCDSTSLIVVLQGWSNKNSWINDTFTENSTLQSKWLCSRHTLLKFVVVTCTLDLWLCMWDCKIKAAMYLCYLCSLKMSCVTFVSKKHNWVVLLFWATYIWLKYSLLQVQ